MALLRSKVKIAMLLGLALLFCEAHATRRGLVDNNFAVFDVTHFRAEDNTKFDSNMAFTRTWIAACHSQGPTKVVVPPGNYMSGEVFWVGPCKGHVTVEVQGSITANKDISKYPNDVWFRIENVDGFTIDGANFQGSFHGSGNASWQYDTCKDVNICEYPPLPPNFFFKNVKNGDVGFLSSIDSKGYHFKIVDNSNVHLHNLNIQASSNSPHTNAADVISSDNIQVTESTINTGGGPDCVIWGVDTKNNVYNQVSCNGH